MLSRFRGIVLSDFAERLFSNAHPGRQRFAAAPVAKTVQLPPNRMEFFQSLSQVGGRFCTLIAANPKVFGFHNPILPPPPPKMRVVGKLGDAGLRFFVRRPRILSLSRAFSRTPARDALGVVRIVAALRTTTGRPHAVARCLSSREVGHRTSGPIETALPRARPALPHELLLPLRDKRRHIGRELCLVNFGGQEKELPPRRAWDEKFKGRRLLRA